MRHKLFAVFIICTVLSAGCAPIRGFIAKPTPGYYPDLSIRVERGGGMCITCGSRLEIDGNGNASYGWWDSGSTDSHSTKLTPQQIEELVAAIKRANIFALSEKDKRPAVLSTDPVLTGISITLNGQSTQFSLSDYDCRYNGYVDHSMAPCKLAHKIKTIAKMDKWAGATMRSFLP